MGKIVYLGFYDEPNGGRNCSPAAVTVMEYVNDVLNRLNKDVVLISPAEDKHGNYRAREEKTLNPKTKLVFLESLKKNKNIFLRAIRRLKQKRILWRELNKQVDNGDTVIAYHSLYLINFIKKLQKRKRIKFVLQFCEVYADVTGKVKDKKKEFDFAQTADAYIFSSESLNEFINVKNKPTVSLYGTYKVDNQSLEKFDDGRIHCVYAGTFDPRKGGVAAAAAAGAFLNENYHIHILGFGSEDEKKMLITTIKETQSKSNCKITYDGLLSGKEYVSFLRKCHIGLSTQNPNAAFNATSFPSKVLSYLSNGLRVVSVRLPVLENSEVNDLLYYYEEASAQAIAKTIKNINIFELYDSRKKIQGLDKEFEKKLGKMLMQYEKA